MNTAEPALPGRWCCPRSGVGDGGQGGAEALVGGGVGGGLDLEGFFYVADVVEHQLPGKQGVAGFEGGDDGCVFGARLGGFVL